MDAQEPAEGILKTNDYGDSKFYLITCQCGNSEDEIRVEVEAEDTGVSVHHWVKVKTARWGRPTQCDWLNGLIHRFKMTYSLWINGYLEYESWTMMSPQQTFNYAYTLKRATDDVRQFREARKQQPCTAYISS
jgi:hypothetical protein